jgi:hypothetical protein
MQKILAGSTLQLVLNRKIMAAAGLLSLGILAALLAIFQIVSAAQQAPASAPLAPAALEAHYGLRVDLVAVTAAGGMVDVRFKIVDAQKAKALLGQAANYPVLWIAGKQVSLTVPEDSRPQMAFENGGSFYLLFPNTQNAVQRGTPVTLVFGSLRVEAILAR